MALDSNIVIAIVSASASLGGAVIGGSITYLLNKQLHKLQIELIKTQYKTEFAAEETVSHFLNHKGYTDRSFEALKNHLGGFEDNELRRILVRAGAVMIRRDGDKEYWRLLSRMDEYISNKKSKNS